MPHRNVGMFLNRAATPREIELQYRTVTRNRH